MTLPYAHTLNFWKTGKSNPSSWLEKAVIQIEKLGGSVRVSAWGKDDQGRKACMITFDMDGSSFKVFWPVLPVEDQADQLAAERQAATMLYHEIKERCLKIKIFGTRFAFFEYLLLPDGRLAVDATLPELREGLPATFDEVGGKRLVGSKL